MNPKIKIAYAEDHALMRDTISALLRENGFNVVYAAANGEELIKELADVEVLPDLCLLDVRMPVLDGYQTASEIRKRWPGIKIIAFSMDNQESCIVRMFKSGACAYIVKTGHTDEILNSIRHVYKHGFNLDVMQFGALVRYIHV